MASSTREREKLRVDTDEGGKEEMEEKGRVEVDEEGRQREQRKESKEDERS